MNFFLKLNKIFKEKRFFKTIKKKLYPYFFGFLLFFYPKKKFFKIHISNLNKIYKEDLPLAERIFKSYKLMKTDQESVEEHYKPSSLWQSQINENYSFLINSYKENDLEKFLYFLQNFGNWEDYLGVENQTFMKKFNKNIFLRNFLLNEVFQGQFDLWKLFNKNKDINELEMPNYGNHLGAKINNIFVLIGSFSLHNHAENLQNYLKEEENKILELGGGYGQFAYYILKKTKKYTYIDFDLPETLTLASYFLSKAFPDKKNFFYGESKFNKNVEKEYDLIFLPSWEIESLEENSVDLAINKNSLGEMSPKAAKNYLFHIHRTSNYFFSMNHEYFRNKFSDGQVSLINSEYNLDNKFKVLIRYPDLGHLIWENNKLDFENNIFFYIYEKIK